MRLFGKIVLCLVLVALCVSNVNAQGGCTGSLAVVGYGSSGSAVAGYGSSGSAVAGYGSSGSAGYGVLRKVTARATRPVVNTLAYVAQNRPRPLARLAQAVRPANYVQVATVAPLVAVRSANCGCVNCTCGDNCNCGSEIAAVNYVQAVQVQAVPVLRTRDVVYNCDACGQAHVAPVATVVKNLMTVVPRTIQNVRAVR